MAVNNVRQQVAYGLTNALQNVPNAVIVSTRVPLATDKAPIGQVWVVPSLDDVYMLTSIVANVSTWLNLAGAAGTFTSLTVATFITAGTTITAGTGITSTTGNIVATAGAVNAGTTMTAGTGMTATTGNIVAAAGNISATLGSVAAGTSVTAGTTVTATLGNITATNGDFVASTAAKGVVLGGGAKLVCGTGDPNATVTAPKGSLYMRLDGSGIADRAYINTNGTTAWTNLVTAA